MAKKHNIPCFSHRCRWVWHMEKSLLLMDIAPPQIFPRTKEFSPRVKAVAEVDMLRGRQSYLITGALCSSMQPCLCMPHTLTLPDTTLDLPPMHVIEIRRAAYSAANKG